MLLGLCCTLVLVLPPTLSAFAQPFDERGKPYLTAWLPQDYGAEAQNWAIAQDDRGVMYFGNNSGVLEYDGVSWRLIQPGKTPVCRSLAKGPDGRIYVGGVGDFGYLAPDRQGQLHFVSLLAQVPPDARAFSDVFVINVQGGSVYFNTVNHLFRWTPAPSADPDAEPAGTLKRWEPNSAYHMSFVVEDVFYIRENGKGLLRMVRDALQPVPGGEQFANERIYVMLPFPDAAGRPGILVGTRTQGLFRYDGQTFHPFKTEADDFLRQNALYLPGAALRNGRVLLNTTNGGAVVLDRNGKRLQTIDRDSGLPVNTVYYVYADPVRPETQWLALENGIARMEAVGPFSIFDATRGLTSATLKIQRHNGVLYAATNVGIFYLDAASQTFHPLRMPAVQSWDFLPVEGHLLAATFNGVYAIRDKQATLVRPSVNNDFSAIALHRSRKDDRRVFVGLYLGGLASLRLEQGRWRDEGRAAELHANINRLVETADGTLWASLFDAGVLRLTFPTHAAGQIWQAAQVERFGPEQGQPEGAIRVYDIGGSPYFVAKDDVYRFDDPTRRFVVDTTFRMTPPPATRQALAEDGQGRVWVLGDGAAQRTRTPDGRSVWLRTPFRRFAHEKMTTVYPEEDGVVWFGGINGIIRFDAQVEMNYAVAYPALVRRVVVGADSVLFGGTIPDGMAAPVLAYAYNHLRFAYAASSYEDARRLHFQTWLEGFDDDWSDWNGKTEKEYTNLPEGDYRFRVRARNGYDHLSQEAVFAFTILPPWWRTWWAYTLYGLLLGGAVFATDRVQRRRLLRKERERAYLREREIRAEALLREQELRAEAAEYLANYLQAENQRQTAENQRQTAENQRQTQELEQARQLQLSMLPRTMPTHPAVELAAYMKTATEVGGDYYDADLSEDGTLTLVIGDATGHGLPAGTMVTATKGILGVLAREQDLGGVLRRASEAVRRMRLPRLYMALALVRLRGQVLEVAGAGMPPAMVYRAATGSIDVVPLKGMPLGGPGRFVYQPQQVVLSAGDTVLLMSDGLPELRGAEGEFLDYNRIAALLSEVAGQTPEEVIAHLLEGATDWCSGTAPDDDITLIVLKVK